MNSANHLDGHVVDWIQRDTLMAFFRAGVPIALIYAILAYFTFSAPAMDLLTSATILAAGFIAYGIVQGRLPKAAVHGISLLLLLDLGYVAYHLNGFQSMVFTALPAFALLLRFIAGTWSASLFAMGLTVWGGVLLSHPHWIENRTLALDPSYDHSKLVILFLTNLFVLWFAGVPVRMIRTAFTELSRSAAVLERKVEERTLDLERANRELVATNAGLDAFSQSVSHDLRAPLRGILSYTKTVLEDEQKHLSDESKAYLAYSIQAANRSNELIDGFLELARSSTKTLQMVDCDLAQMATTAIGALRRQDPSRVVEYIGPESAVAYGDRSLLRSVVENLVSNAWKYTGKTPRARIEFTVEADLEGTLFVIRDNGVGFEMAQSDRLFHNFSRLHSNDDFEGTGIGLSNVHRILERHGGWIRAKGEPGKGAEFRFRLPPGPDAPV